MDRKKVFIWMAWIVSLVLLTVIGNSEYKEFEFVATFLLSVWIFFLTLFFTLEKKEMRKDK